MNDYNKKPCTDCLSCTNRAKIFDLMSEEELKIINDNKFEVTFRPGETVCKQGTKTTHVISINKGLLKLYLEGSDDRNFLLDYIKPTILVIGPGGYVDERYYFSAVAVVESKACMIDFKIFREIMRNNQKMSEYMIQEISQRVLSHYDRFITLTQKQVYGRVADALIHLSTNIFNEPPHKLLVTRQDICEFTGMTKDTAGKILNELNRDKIIQYNTTEIIILNMEKLIYLSQNA